MKEGYIIRNQEKAHFITATVVDWIDVFTRKTYRDCIIECLDYCIQNKGMILYGYVIMSNHIHMIIQSENAKLSDLVRDFKKFTAKTILEKILILLCKVFLNDTSSCPISSKKTRPTFN